MSSTALGAGEGKDQEICSSEDIENIIIQLFDEWKII